MSGISASLKGRLTEVGEEDTGGSEDLGECVRKVTTTHDEKTSDPDQTGKRVRDRCDPSPISNIRRGARGTNT